MVRVPDRQRRMRLQIALKACHPSTVDLQLVHATVAWPIVVIIAPPDDRPCDCVIWLLVCIDHAALSVSELAAFPGEVAQGLSVALALIFNESRDARNPDAGWKMVGRSQFSLLNSTLLKHIFCRHPAYKIFKHSVLRDRLPHIFLDVCGGRHGGYVYCC